MEAKNSLGKKVAVLIKGLGKSQTQIAKKTGMSVSQVNRFLQGRSDLTAQNMIDLLNEVGIDLVEIVNKKMNIQMKMESNSITSIDDCVNFLFSSLDDLGKQTYLNSLLWAARINKKSMPERLVDILSREVKLI